MSDSKISIKEKVGYALGDAATNIAWRGVATYLLIFYTDVVGLLPATVGFLMLIARSSDGISDVLMGIIGDRTSSKYGKFRPWILWTAIPFAVMLSLLFTAPDLSYNGKIIYAYLTYILFTLIYTASNIPYGALMALMTDDDRERSSIGSYRMVGAFAGGMLVQGALLFLVAHFGNVKADIQIEPIDKNNYHITILANDNVSNAGLSSYDNIAKFKSCADTASYQSNYSFEMVDGETYQFIAHIEANQLKEANLQIIDQKKGYSYSMYILSVVLAISLLVTFFSTKERIVAPPKEKSNLRQDFTDLIRNKPWVILLIIGLLFNIYNAIKQGIVVIYFTHYMHNQLLAASYMAALTLISIFGAIITTPLAKRFGKKNLFIVALILSAVANAMIIWCGTSDVADIFSLGLISELFAAIFPTLFFAMLADVADYSEWKNGRRATGLIYSAGSFASKFGGGIAGAIIGLVLTSYHYNGLDPASIDGAITGIKMLMSWIPSIIALFAAGVMMFYTISQSKMNEITRDLKLRREN